MAPQNYTLKDLKESVDRHIEDQGENAPCAVWLYTKYDIAFIDKEGETIMYGEELIKRVLSRLWDYDYIFTTISDCIEECLSRSGI